VLGGLLLQGVGDLGGLHSAAEESSEGVTDRALQSPFEALDDAHRHLLMVSRSVPVSSCGFGSVLSSLLLSGLFDRSADADPDTWTCVSAQTSNHTFND